MPEYFFVVGAQRSGTTYLYQILDEHPHIEMAKPIKPEPKFFHVDSLFEQGLNFYQQKFFSDANALLYGEKSATYIESEKAARRISATFPRAKILMILRDPIERAISNYWFSVNGGFETLSMEEAFLPEAQQRSYDPQKISVSPYAYLKRGRYIDYLLMYERYFPAENIKVMGHEQLVGSHEQVSDLYHFLGVSNYTPPILNTAVNKGHKPNTSLSPEMRQYLVDTFAEPNARLAKHLSLSLDAWQR